MGNTSEDKMIGVSLKLDKQIKELTEKMASAQGITFSEYVRSLIIGDLDKRTFFTTQVKKELAKSGGK